MEHGAMSALTAAMSTYNLTLVPRNSTPAHGGPSVAELALEPPLDGLLRFDTASDEDRVVRRTLGPAARQLVAQELGLERIRRAEAAAGRGRDDVERAQMPLSRPLATRPASAPPAARKRAGLADGPVYKFNEVRMRGAFLRDTTDSPLAGVHQRSAQTRLFPGAAGAVNKQ